MLDQIEENEERAKVAPFAFKQGIFLGLFLIIYTIVVQFANLATNQNVGYISYLIFIGVIIWSMFEFRAANQGYMEYGQGVGLGFLTSLVGGLISALFSLFYMYVIDPKAIERMLATMRITMEEQNPQMTDDQIDIAMSYVGWVFQPMPMFFMALLGSAFIGIIFSLIIALFIKRAEPNPF